MRYYVNKHAQLNKDHEVHKETCSFLPIASNRIDLGIHNNCEEAVKEAKKHFSKSNGCFFCAKNCHTT